MATIENIPPPMGPASEANLQESGTSVLNQMLARVYLLDWETIFYIVLFATAILTRFVNLGDRVMSHDESLHTKFSFTLFKEGSFQHTPLMHGPVLFHAVAFMYFLFGDSDFTARLYPAILGIMLVMMPRVLFSRWLGKRGAMVACVLLLISPMVLYHNRYIREDTPSIFYTLIMVYAIFRYVDGVRPRQARWLLVLSGATLLSLASKEVAFMYIAIFGSFLTLFWLVQVLQGLSRGEVDPVVGRILGGLFGLGLVGGGALLLGAPIADKFGISHLPVEGVVLIVLGGALLAFLSPLRNGLAAIGMHANSATQLVITGILMGAFASLVMTVIINIVPLKNIFGVEGGPAPDMVSHLILWTALLVIVLAVTLFGTMLVGFARVRRLPILEIVSILAIAFVVCSGLTFEEERSKGAPNVSSEHAQALDPNNPTASATSVINQNLPIVGAWLLGAVICVGLLALRLATPFFDEMKEYPVFDVLVIMGTLVLPWLTAIPMFMAGYQLDNYPASQEVINAGIASAIPFVAVAIVGGLCWNPPVFIACAATFYSIFAFFFTTVFTNPQGIISGAIGSLGYWLAQQGVRRGSQPQYYYLLVELPVYEYLPVIGVMAASVAGLLGVWRFRADRYAEADSRVAEAQLAAAQAAEQTANPEIGLDGNPVIMAMADPLTESPINQTQISRSTEAFEMPLVGALDSLTSEVPPENDPLADVPMEQGIDGTVEDGISMPRKRKRENAPRDSEWLERLPILGFFGYWTVLITYAFTISGEKMPWLTTHLAIPMIFITGWYLGRLLNQVEWPQFFRQGWGLLLFSPILIIALVNVFGPFLTGKQPFAGLQRDQLLNTGTWLAALLVTFLVLYGVNRVLSRIGARQTVLIAYLGVFAFLGLITIRTAWRFAYINYDSATEFGVYAHGAPAVKTVMNKIEEISKQTTDGLGIKVGYDNSVSWPGEWYFRNYTKRTFLGDMTGATDLESYAALVVGGDHAKTVSDQVGDKFYKFDFIRLWWPMQDYFDLTPVRVDNVFAGDDVAQGQVRGSALRQGLWDIWWNRDYTAYGTATGKSFDISQWPVADRMAFFVRKDFAAQVWDLGVGGVTASAPAAVDAFAKLRCDTCRADSTFGSRGTQPGQMDHPRGMAAGPDGKLYVADSLNARINVFDATGKFVTSFGTPGDVDKGAAPGGTFREPWSVAVGKDGLIYVSDTWNHRVQVFTPDYQFVRMWGHFEQVANGQPGTPDGFYGPRDITVDAQNHVYVSDTGNKRIRVYSNDGKFLYNIGSGGAAPGQFNEPTGIVLSPDGSLIYVADTWNKRIEVFSTNGTFRNSWTVQNSWPKSSEDTGNRPYMTLDKTGTRLFVTDPDSARVFAWDVTNALQPNGEQALLVFGAKGTVDLSHFDVLGGITTDPSGALYLVDAGSSRILKISPAALPGVIVVPPALIPPAVGNPTDDATKDDSF